MDPRHGNHGPSKRPRYDEDNGGNRRSGNRERRSDGSRSHRGEGDGERGGNGYHRGGGDRGRGGGRGRGRGRKERLLQSFDAVLSRDPNLTSKTGETGTRYEAIANYFPVICNRNWAIQNYRVDFDPDPENTKQKKDLVRLISHKLGPNIFDGSNLYTTREFEQNSFVLMAQMNQDPQPTTIKFRHVAELNSTDVMFLHFFNIIIRKCMGLLGLEEMGRHFYDYKDPIKMKQRRLVLWPGYKTAIRRYEHNICLCVETTHKVIRNENCLDTIRHAGRQGPRKIKEELEGSIVMTHYNRMTYRVDEVDFDMNPKCTFDQKGVQVTYLDYYRARYGLEIRDLNQPLLISRPTKRDLHRGMRNNIYLIPELCQLTGITDEMRADFKFTQELSSHLNVKPDQRVNQINKFMATLLSSRTVVDELSRWDLKLSKDMCKVPARQLNEEVIRYGNGKTEVSNGFDWTQSLTRNYYMLTSAKLTDWALIIPFRDGQKADHLRNSLDSVGRTMNFPVPQPRKIVHVQGNSPQEYTDAIEKVMSHCKGVLNLLFAVLPKQSLELYGAVKKSCYQNYGISSQCFVAKNLKDNMKSIASKVVIQINAKLGGEPWALGIPLKKLMVVGFDIHHPGKGKRKNAQSVGAMVASTNSNITKYFSCVSFHNTSEQLSANLSADFGKCLNAYKKVNNELPERIIMYRDGVGEGDLGYVYNTEVQQIKTVLTDLYSAQGKSLPKFTFIVVTKKINTRIFKWPDYNPLPGTVVDDVVTLPERYDFFLVAQNSKQGTASPTSYNVLVDDQGLSPDKLQRFTFKLCHLYFNYSGTVTVPAPCQCARKLAYLTGTSLGGPVDDKLSHLLYYM